MMLQEVGLPRRGVGLNEIFYLRASEDGPEFEKKEKILKKALVLLLWSLFLLPSIG